MSTYTSEPGTRLGGRYRLEDRVAAVGGWAAWKAIDETLARPVTVLTFAPAFPHLREVVTAARAASRLNDSRFAQVFDVEDDWDHAYIVSEWPSADTLDDMLAAGPIEPDRGARIIAEASEAFSAAHAAGLAHLCLLPSSLRWTPGGGVKITGLGINAALSGATAENPALADTHRLGMLLYAALTGFWPGPDCPTLPPAPMADGYLRSPRQVRAGVPGALDEITSQALQLRERDGSSGFATPGDLAAALLAAIPPAPIPQLARPQRQRHDGRTQSRRPGPDPGYWSPDQQQDPRYPTPDGRQAGDLPGSYSGRPDRPGGTPRGRSVVAVLLAVAVVAGITFAVLHLTGSHGSGRPGAVIRPPVTHTQGPGTAVLTPVSDQALDETNANAAAALGNTPGQFWQTQFYIGNPVFGGVKQGAGLVLNMGHPVRLSSVTVTFGSIPGANVEIRIGTPSAPLPPPTNDPNSSQTPVDQQYADSLTTVAQQNDVSGQVNFPVTSTASGQYVLIWFTKLPPMAQSSNRYQAEIYNVVVKGSSS